ncbi:MAG: hypothetical protein WCQ54_00805 [Clostridiaceae bacterium]
MKKTGILLTSILLISLIGQIVYASTVNYALTLPTIGTNYTNSCTKATTGTTAYNNCTFFGWSGSGVNEWVERQSDNVDLTVTGWFSGAVNSSFGYLTPSAASDNVGKSVHFAMKTDSSTWHQCDVKGTADPK